MKKNSKTADAKSSKKQTAKKEFEFSGYGYLQFMGPHENDKRSVTAARQFSVLAGRWIDL